MIENYIHYVFALEFNHVSFITKFSLKILLNSLKALTFATLNARAINLIFLSSSAGQSGGLLIRRS